MQKYNFKKEVNNLLKQEVTEEEAKYLKKNFGLPRRKTDKGVLLLAALFDLAVHKGSVPAAKEFFGLTGAEGREEDNGMLENIIAAVAEVEK